MNGNETNIVIADEAETISTTEDTTTINTESIPTETPEESNVLDTNFIDDSNVRAFELLNLKSKIKDIEAMSDKIKQGTKTWLSDDTDDHIEEVIDERLRELTDDEISKMSSEEIDELLTIDDIEIKFSIDFHGRKNEELKFKRDFLIYRKRANDAIATFDAEMTKINAEIAGCQEEFNDIVSKFSNVNNLIRHTINEKLENAKTDAHKELYTKIRDNFEFSFTLDNFKKYLSSYKLKNIVSDFVIYERSMKVFNKYKKMMTKMKIKDDIRVFTEIEKKIIDDYSGRDNIIMFAMMHYIASQSNVDDIYSFGLFVTQFIVNMKNFIYDKFDNENEKETFINALKDVINIIG